MNTVFAPGCALMVYKPASAKKLLAIVQQELGAVPAYLTCCKHPPAFAKDTRVINTCPGCDRRYRELYEHVSTISLWEVLANSERFPFPDYQGKAMTILDACPTRDQARVHEAIRTLLTRMHITLIEPEHTKEHGRCCGDSFFGELPLPQVTEQMARRASEMPVADVVVYCVSCCISMHIGGKTPRYLVDLLLGEPTIPHTRDLDAWHRVVDDFVEQH